MRDIADAHLAFSIMARRHGVGLAVAEDKKRKIDSLSKWMEIVGQHFGNRWT